MFAVERRGELMQLVTSYRRLKSELGLMDFSDQISLGARLAEEHPDVGALERQRFKVVLLDEYQDTSVAQARMLARLFSGPDAASGRGPRGDGGGRPQPGDLRLARRLGVQHPQLRRDASRPPRGEVPVLPLTVNRRSDRQHPRRSPTPSPPRCTPRPRWCARSSRSRMRSQGQVAARVFETQDGELAWLAGGRDARPTPGRGRTSACSPATTPPPSRSSTRSPPPASRSRSSASPACCGCPRWPRSWRCSSCSTTSPPTPPCSPCSTARGGPSVRATCGCCSERAAELAGQRGRAESATIDDQLTEIADGIDPAELPALSDALDDPGHRRPTPPEALERFALLAAELRSLRSYAGEPILDVVRRIVDTTGIDIELASAVSPAAAARRDNVDLFLKAVAEFQAIDGDVTLPAAARLPAPPRTTRATASTSPPRPRPTRSSC